MASRAHLLLAFVVLLPRISSATEMSLLTEAIFHRLSPTQTFDLNADSDVSAPDLTARAVEGEPGSAGCGNAAPPEGAQRIVVADVTRDYIVRLPAGYDPSTPHPILFGFHGFLGNAASIENVTDLPENWPEAIGIYPQGLPRSIPIFGNIMGPGWQLAAGELEDRDVHLYDALLDHALATYCINPERVYVTGHSNGAFFTHVLACNRGGQIAAAAPRSGGVIGCPGETQVAMIISHGTSDPIVPFTAGSNARNIWSARNDCGPSTAPYEECELETDCADDRQVTFCPYDGGHQPNPAFPPTMFRFFKEHAL